MESFIHVSKTAKIKNVKVFTYKKNNEATPIAMYIQAQKTYKPLQKVEMGLYRIVQTISKQHKNQIANNKTKNVVCPCNTQNINKGNTNITLMRRFVKSLISS